VVAAAGAVPRQQLHVQPVSIPEPKKFNGSRDKLRSFISHIHMKLAGDTSRFPNPQHQFRYTFELLVRKAFMQVKAYIANEGINLTDVPALITVCMDSKPVTTAECKLEALK
jgi:hypothetical protein